MRIKPFAVITALLIKSMALDSPLTDRGKSKGLILFSLDREIFIYVPPTASDKCLYSVSGSIIITSVPIIKERITSNFTA